MSYHRGVAGADETSIREAHQRGDFKVAAEQGLQLYGAEIRSFLAARLLDDTDTRDVFSELTEDLWRGIANFEWRSSFRTWIYTLARHAALRFERKPVNQQRRRERLSQINDPIVVERSQTRPYLRTDIKDAFAALRASLTPDEQSLLTLRIDRDLPWDEIAQIIYDDDERDPAKLQRHATNLRQRFRQLKSRIKEWAQSEGLLDDER